MGFSINILKRKQPPPPSFESEESRAIMALIGCPYKWVNTDNLTADDVTGLYKARLAEGRQQGFVPLIILPSPELLEMLEMHAEREAAMGRSPDAGRRIMIEAAAQINIAALIAERYEAALPPDPDFLEQNLIGPITGGSPLDSFATVRDIAAQRLVPELILADIPTERPEHLPAWVPMGSFLSGPPPEEQIALFSHWRRHFGCLPALISADSWECYIENPPATATAALGLAKEQMAFCPELIYSGLESLGALAHSLIKALIWCFWWSQ